MFQRVNKTKVFIFKVGQVWYFRLREFELLVENPREGGSKKSICMNQTPN